MQIQKLLVLKILTTFRILLQFVKLNGTCHITSKDPTFVINTSEAIEPYFRNNGDVNVAGDATIKRVLI